jgi:hypothetical protein
MSLRAFALRSGLRQRLLRINSVAPRIRAARRPAAQGSEGFLFVTQPLKKKQLALSN